MARERHAPFPQLKAHNLRSRAAQMRVIAGAIENPAARAVLLRKADLWSRMADAAERETAAGARPDEGADERAGRAPDHPQAA